MKLSILCAVALAGCVGDDVHATSDASVASDAATDTTTDSAVGCDARTADDVTGVFVTATGSDVGGCGARANPCKTLGYAFAAAKAAPSKTTLYVAAGAYEESIDVDAPISIEGGWNASGGSWKPICDTTTSTAVTLQGTTNITITASYTGDATFRYLRITSKASADPSESLYGIFATGEATKLTLDQVITSVNGGGDGAPGMDGTPGANAGDAGCAPANGANGSDGPSGAGGATGTLSANGYVATNGSNGAAGGDGQNGASGGQGQCQTCEISTGSCPNNCGFGTSMTCGGNGVSGCAGGGGGAGTPGTAGGASIAVYVWQANVTVFGGSYASSSGGSGGNGGAGADGGAGTSGAAGASAFCATQMSSPQCAGNKCFATVVTSTTLNGGSSGGAGGAGGVGGHGGGGSGGWSYAIVTAGDGGGVLLTNNPKLLHGGGGTGGAVGGATGSSGDRWP